MSLTARFRGVATALWDFVVGDDWRLALGVAVGLGITAFVAGLGMVAWWIMPAVAGALLAASVWRASDSDG